MAPLLVTTHNSGSFRVILKKQLFLAVLCQFTLVGKVRGGGSTRLSECRLWDPYLGGFWGTSSAKGKLKSYLYLKHSGVRLYVWNVIHILEEILGWELTFTDSPVSTDRHRALAFSIYDVHLFADFSPQTRGISWPPHPLFVGATHTETPKEGYLFRRKLHFLKKSLNISASQFPPPPTHFPLSFWLTSTLLNFLGCWALTQPTNGKEEGTICWPCESFLYKMWFFFVNQSVSYFWPQQQ